MDIIISRMNSPVNKITRRSYHENKAENYRRNFPHADKFARSGLTASKAETVDAPVINEFPICLECRFIEYQNNEYGCGVIGKVVNVTADESVMVDGKIDMSKVNAIAFDPYTHGYYKVTERVGEAFRDGLKLKK